ncbi:MAG TPA: hypothetical protein VLB68_28750 [Pyrinomonadaceae bacterium]|nr:hypothetical protein [Pyrinomonadaceae bacterium]
MRSRVEPWKLTSTTTVEGTIDDTDLGRRSLKRWDERQCWWIDLPEPLCKKAKLDIGDEVRLTIRLASDDLPDELKRSPHKQFGGESQLGSSHSTAAANAS